MTHLTCAACGQRLTRDCRIGEAWEHDITVADRDPTTPVGVMVRLDREDAAPVTGPPDGQVIKIHVFSPAGAISINPQDLIEDATTACGLRNGCCGPDGMDGPNLACLCGQTVATEWGDCWTQAEIRFLPDAVKMVETA